MLLLLFHPPARFTANLFVSQLSFTTDKPSIFKISHYQQVDIAGIASVDLDVDKSTWVGDHKPVITGDRIELRGDEASACSFYNVEASPITLSEKPHVTIRWVGSRPNSLLFAADKTLRGELKAEPAAHLNSGLSCRHISVNGRAPMSIDVRLSEDAVIPYITVKNAAVNFFGPTVANIDEHNVPIIDQLRISQVQLTSRDSPQESTVLLAPPPGHIDQLVFEVPDKAVPIQSGDLISIEPDKTIYLAELKINDGISVRLHGRAKNVFVGAGAKDMSNRMPTLFEGLTSIDRLILLLPAVLSTLLWPLQKFGLVD